MKSGDLTVVKGNTLIESSYTLTLFEKRILLACIAKIDSTQQFTKKDGFTIKVNEIQDLVTDKNNSIYNQIKISMDRLGERWLSLNETGSDKVRWIYRKKYNDNEGSITLYFTDEILPFLSELKGNFTKYKLQYVAKFKSIHSIRVYELLVQWLSRGDRELEVDQLKKMLGVEGKYIRTNNFIEKVIKPSINDINTLSNLDVAYGVRKTGKQVTHIQFKFNIKAEAEDIKKQQPITLEQFVRDNPSRTKGKSELEVRKMMFKNI